MSLIFSHFVFGAEPAKFKGSKLYVADSSAKDWANANTSGAQAVTAKLILERIASMPQAIWANNSRFTRVRPGLEEAAAKGEVAVIVMYNIPHRDSGQYSAGGEDSPQGYKKFVDSLSALIGTKSVMVIVEPDALSLMQDLVEKDQKIRLELLRYAVQTIKKNRNAMVYLDAGHSNWHSVIETATRLKLAGMDAADGFALNTSNFRSTAESTTFGEKVSKLVGNKHFIIDTSRNGNGPWDSKEADIWCNPPGRALGQKPTFDTKNPLIDAFLWVKRPGESDGTCRGGPAAGQFWSEYALGLIKNSK